MAQAWAPPEPSHYERAETALSVARADPGLGRIPTNAEQHWTYGVALTMTLAGAVVHALLAVADRIEDVTAQLGHLREGK